MSYWSHNPELLDEITIKALPEEWKEKVENEEIDLYDIPDKIFDKAMFEGEREYFAGLADNAYDQERDRRAEMVDKVIKREKIK